MASVGEGAARGLEAGFRMAMDIHARRRAEDRDARMEERQGRMDQRQAGLDQRAQADHDRNLQRQQNQDELAAIEMEGKDVAAQGAIYSANRPKDPAVLDAYANRAQAYQEKRNAWKARNSGPNAAAAASQEKAEQQAVLAGQAPPEMIVRHVERLSGLPADDYMDLDGQGSAVQRAGAQIMSDDPKERARGFNKIHHSMLQKGVGQPGRFPDTVILRKDIENVVPDPNSSEADPRVIPTLRVWVKGPKPFNGPPIEGAPEGATGYYLAPMTEGQSSDPQADPNVKSVSIKQTMKRVDTLMQIAEAMNQPDGQAAYAKYRAQRDAQGGADSGARFETALAAMGVKKAKPSVNEFGLKAGESRVRQQIDPDTGAVLSETRTEGNAKPATAGAAQKDIDAIDAAVDNDVISAEEGTRLKKMRLQTTAQGGKARGLGGGEGGGEGGDGLSAAQKRKRDADRDVLKGTAERADKNADNAEKAVEVAQKALHTLETRAGGLMYDKKEHGPEDDAERKRLKAEIAEKDVLAKKARGRASSLSDALDKPQAAGGLAKGVSGAAVQFARNPKTGERLMLQGGKWVPAK